MSGPVLVIPVKATIGAKQRLGSRVSMAERRLLALAMAGDALRLAAATAGRHRIVVVAGDDDVEVLARRQGVACVREHGAGQSSAVGAGATWAMSRGFTSLATMAADCPLACAEDVDTLMNAAAQRGRFLACATDAGGTGTNAAALRPPGAGVWRFGPNSLQRHREAAGESGLRFIELELPSLRVDADRAEDLAVIAAAPAPTATFQVLRQIGLVEGRVAG